MDREEILKAVKEQGKTDINNEFEISIERKAVLTGMSVGIILCVSIIIFELLVVKRFDWGKPVVLLGVSSVTELYEGIVRKNMKKTICGAGLAIIAVLFLIIYIGGMLV